MKTKNAFALRRFDFDSLNLQPKINTNDFDQMQKARKSYFELFEELEALKKKIIRHLDRLLRYQMMLSKDVAKLNDDRYWFSFYKPRSKRAFDLSEKYGALAQKINETKESVEGIIYNLDQSQRGYYAKIFAKKLREARKCAGLTQSELATRLGIKRNTYNAYETARNEPNVSLLALISKEFNLKPNWFLEF